jgi:uncharacterized OB-fold protein
MGHFEVGSKKGSLMSNPFHTIEPMVYRSRISVPYTWWAGETAGRFLTSLRDERVILGTRCDGCDRVFVPPRKTCPTCFTANETWLPVGPAGTVVAYTVARRQLAAIRQKVPVVFALVRLDGADTAILHTIAATDPGRVSIGMRVKACFSDQADSTMAAIAHFEPEI